MSLSLMLSNLRDKDKWKHFNSILYICNKMLSDTLLSQARLVLSRDWFLWVHDDRITNTVYWMSWNISKYFRMLLKLPNNWKPLFRRHQTTWFFFNPIQTWIRLKRALFVFLIYVCSIYLVISYLPCKQRDCVWEETTAEKGMCENMVMVRYWQYKVSFKLHHNFLVSTRHSSFGTYFEFFGKCFISLQNTLFIQIKKEQL